MNSLAHNFRERTTETGMKYLQPLPDYQIVQSIEYHWLTGNVTRIIYRKAEEIIELMDDADERGNVVQK